MPNNVFRGNQSLTDRPRSFANPSTEAQAYWIGFLAADGCVMDNGMIQLGLAERDANHVYSFVNFIGYRGKIHVRERKVGQRIFQVSFVCRKMANDLAKVGIVPRKSKTLLPWLCPEKLIRHYWRGLVDGDGSVTECSDKPMVSLNGTLAVVEALSSWVGLKCGRSMPIRQVRGIFEARATGSEFARVVSRFLYGSCKVFLERKKQSADSILNAPIKAAMSCWIEYEGKWIKAGDVARMNGIPMETASQRIRCGGWDLISAITKPRGNSGPGSRKVIHNAK